MTAGVETAGGRQKVGAEGGGKGEGGVKADLELGRARALAPRRPIFWYTPVGLPGRPGAAVGMLWQRRRYAPDRLCVTGMFVDPDTEAM